MKPTAPCEISSARLPRHRAVAYLFLVRRMRASLLLGAAMLVSCRTWDSNHLTVLSRSGQTLCAKHHVPLVSVRAYGAPVYRDRVILVNDNSLLYSGVALSNVPNPIPVDVSLRPTGILRRPMTISYCPLCEKEYRDFLRVPDERAAIKYVRDALPMWTPARGVATGPYQTSLSGDVWTVSCSTTDGYRIMVKIGKEEGRLLSYQAAK